MDFGHSGPLSHGVGTSGAERYTRYSRYTLLTLGTRWPARTPVGSTRVRGRRLRTPGAPDPETPGPGCVGSGVRLDGRGACSALGGEAGAGKAALGRGDGDVHVSVPQKGRRTSGGGTGDEPERRPVAGGHRLGVAVP